MRRADLVAQLTPLLRWQEIAEIALCFRACPGALVLRLGHNPGGRAIPCRESPGCRSTASTQWTSEQRADGLGLCSAVLCVTPSIPGVRLVINSLCQVPHLLILSHL